MFLQRWKVSISSDVDVLKLLCPRINRSSLNWDNNCIQCKLTSELYRSHNENKNLKHGDWIITVSAVYSFIRHSCIENGTPRRCPVQWFNTQHNCTEILNDVQHIHLTNIIKQWGTCRTNKHIRKEIRNVDKDSKSNHLVHSALQAGRWQFYDDPFHRQTLYVYHVDRSEEHRLKTDRSIWQRNQTDFWTDFNAQSTKQHTSNYFEPYTEKETFWIITVCIDRYGVQ